MTNKDQKKICKICGEEYTKLWIHRETDGGNAFINYWWAEECYHIQFAKMTSPEFSKLSDTAWNSVKDIPKEKRAIANG